MERSIFNLITNLILICTTITFIYALEPGKIEFADEETKSIINQYAKNLTEIKDMYVINQKLSKAISRYFKQKLDLFPLYKINLKIDKVPIKIPWTLGQPETDTSVKSREYHIESSKLNTN